MKQSLDLLTQIAQEKILILDGAMGTMIQRCQFGESDYRGERFKDHPIELRGNNDLLSLTQPKAIASIHRSYLEAGADIIETNSFSSTRTSQSDYKLESIVHELNVASATLARQEADAMMERNPQRHCFVAGVMGPTGKTLSISPDVNDSGFRNISFDELSEDYFDSASALMEGGADLLLLETVFDTLNAKAAIYAIKKLEDFLGYQIPLMISGTITDASGRTLSGQTPEAFLYSVAHANPFCVGLNCALGSAAMEKYISEIAEKSWVFSSLHPNAGLPDEMGEYTEDPQYMANVLAGYAKGGLLNIVGGCCGTTPEHIRAFANAMKAISPRKVQEKPQFSFFSGLEPLRIDSDSLFVNVGERTNVAGSARFKRLIREEDFDQALSIARNQVENGAQIVDVNMDDAMLDAKASLVRFLTLAATEPDICRVPIMVDSSRFEAVSAALKSVQGKGIVNSISLKEGEESFLAKAKEIERLGAAILVMAFDEKGQAASCQEKVNICVRSYELLTQKGKIPPYDIIFDANIFAVGTGIEEHDNYALDFINAVGEIRKRCPLSQTSGGVSNVSFSFRGNNALREAIHSVFLYHAISKGLSMGIVNPAQLTIYDDIKSDLRERVEDLVLNRRLDATQRLIEVAHQFDASSSVNEANQLWREEPVEQRVVYSLVKGIHQYIEEDALSLMELLASPLLVIQGPLMEGMNRVGELFGAGKMFLPQVIKSARVMKAGVSALLPFLEAQKSGSEKKGKILLATVKGDVHDIGKNIVSVVLQCNSFEIIDLGVMVSMEDILDKAVENKVDAIGLSGLITPSLEEMALIVTEMERRKMSLPVMVGGATTSEIHTALKIAPCYSAPVVHVNDASLAVNAVSKLIHAETRESYHEQIKEHYQQLREDHIKKREKIQYCSLVEARKRACQLEFDPINPKKWGVFDWKPVSIEELIPYIDWTFYLYAWDLKGKYPDILDDPKKGHIARRLIDDAHEMLKLMARGDWLHPRGVYGLFPATSCEDCVLVYDPENPKKIVEKVPFLRQQKFKKESGETLALSDFILPEKIAAKKGFLRDTIGFFAVSGGFGLDELVDKFNQKGDNYSAITAKILADRFAEASAERLHELVRKEVWGYSPDENISVDAMLRNHYQGIRPAPGYPSCPDHTEKILIYRLLEVTRRVGMTMTDSWMMVPTASVCGYYFSHPESSYFNIGKIDPEQLEDYARRRGVSSEEAKRWLKPNLQ